ALKAGADDYIMKDRMARLVPAVTRALEDAQRRREHRHANEALRESEERFRQLASFLDRRVQERTADLRAANLELQSQMDERKRLESELLEIAENERRRIGFDLHDDIGQRLMGLSMLVKALENKLEQRQLPDAAAAHRVSSLLDEVINHTHDLADWFSSLNLDTRNLRDSLSTLAAGVTSRFEVECHLHAIGPIPDFPPETALQLHKITQEAVGNAIKHGKASKIMLVAGVHEGHFMLQVRNDGVPYQPTEDVSQQLGFRIMNYRAHTIGGHLDIRSNGDAGGTMITCMLPMAGSAALAAAVPSVPLFKEPAPETPPVETKNHHGRMADLTAA
ncbi:MAG TPA: histidine kinase, partial [Clostridia bacterium]|nr:histidine kinase [Clostridia bacterium]